MNDRLHEIFDTMKRNKLRTTLTGLSVSWGIFILILLLGAGNGLKNGVMSNFSERAVNRISLYTDVTSMPYKGLKSGRNIQFTNNDQVDLINHQVKESENVTPKVSKQFTLSNGKNFGSYSIIGVLPAYQSIYKLAINDKEHRFINYLDVKERNKVIVLDKKIAETLFPKQSAIGKYVKVGEISFKVIGVNNKKEQWGNVNAYIPYSTAQVIINPSKKYNEISFTVNGLETREANEGFNESLRGLLSRNLSFDPKDEQALYINNSQRDYIETISIFNGINLFVTVIGILTLIAGIVGVSNIMLVSVKERTREIGIRKAIGAPSSSILKSIILEAVIITAIFGYIGMMFGIGLTELINFVMEQSSNAAASTAGDDEMQMSVFKNPTVGLGYVFFATTLLIIAGVIAGYMPARKAVSVKPIEAMRQE